MRSKAEVERHHDMDRVGNLPPCADRRSGDFELMIMSDSNQEFAPMSKPTTNENDTPDKQPDATPRVLGKWVLPDNCRDVTAERIGEKFALVGPPMRRIEPSSTQSWGLAAAVPT